MLGKNAFMDLQLSLNVINRVLRWFDVLPVDEIALFVVVLMILLDAQTSKNQQRARYAAAGRRRGCLQRLLHVCSHVPPGALLF
mmetsp:Transcript_58475/g.96514  ORF Transcript_58475/g.96514 Transcript_58475/m.96514 type:complete len:84 (-) Transcript_58475:1428-1679(-)